MTLSNLIQEIIQCQIWKGGHIEKSLQSTEQHTILKQFNLLSNTVPKQFNLLSNTSKRVNQSFTDVKHV